MVACVAWKGVPSHTAPSISASLALLKPERSMVLGKGAGVTLDDMINVPSGTPSTLQYGLRFFNASTEADATFFNIVTNEDWTFTFQNVTPAPLPSTIDLSGFNNCLLYTSPSPRDQRGSRMPSSA